MKTTQPNKVPTPRTDEVVWSHCEDGPFVTDHHIALAEFARTLERELVEARNAFDKSYADVSRLQQQLSLLTKPIEPEELRRTVERVESELSSYIEDAESDKEVSFRNDIKTLGLAVRQGEGMRSALEDIATKVCADNYAAIRAREALNQLKTGGDGK